VAFQEFSDNCQNLFQEETSFSQEKEALVDKVSLP
jgi:hypothetical protein